MMVVVAAVAMAFSANTVGQQPSEELARSVSGCGVAASDMSYRWDEELQEAVVSIHQLSLPKSAIECLANMSWKLPVDFEFTSPDLQAQFGAAFAATPDAVAAVRRKRIGYQHWLAQQDLLAGALRIRANGESLAKKAREIEIYCGFAPGSVLHVADKKVWLRPAPASN